MAHEPRPKSRPSGGILRRPSFHLLSAVSEETDREKRSSKKKVPKVVTALPPAHARDRSPDSRPTTADRVAPDSPSAQSPRSAVARRGRPTSIFGSFRSFRSNEDDTPPATSTSSRPPSLNWKELSGSSDFNDIGRSRSVLHHGEAQTNSGLFWKKREYLVLTETHLIRFKNQSKASEIFPSITAYPIRAGLVRHGSTPSTGSTTDMQSLASESSGERIASIPLDKIVAVYQPEDLRHSLSVEVTFLDTEAGQGASVMLQYNDIEERELWTKSLRYAADRARLQDLDPITPKLSEYAARQVEREDDYDIECYKIYKIVKKTSHRTASRASSDDFSKMATTTCFLVIGARKLHLIALPKSFIRGSSSSLSELSDSISFGILALTSVVVSGSDDSFSLTFRQPFQKPSVLHLASLASREIAVELRRLENVLRPNWLERPYIYEVPKSPLDDTPIIDAPPVDDYDYFERTLISYCVAYGISSAGIRYAIDYTAEDAPRFRLLEPEYTPAGGYTALQLLAVFRSLRYNETFASMSFSHCSLASLHGVSDMYGAEHVCTHLSHGFADRLNFEEQRDASLLIQEVRAIAIASRRLRRLDFTACLPGPGNRSSLAPSRNSLKSCGLVEALFPLCRAQATNVDWITLNNIELQEADLDYLVGLVADKTCHFRAIEAGGCGLTDRGATMLLDVFRIHENTLESLDIAHNQIRIVPSILHRQLSIFGYIRKLDLSGLATVSSADPLLPSDILSAWRLDNLRLHGVTLSSVSVEEICKYLAHPQSEVLRELVLSGCSLNGSQAASLMESMTQEPGTARFLHLNLSENNLQRKHALLTSAIARGLAPTHLSMRSMEYDDEDDFKDLLLAVATNQSIRYLDLAKASLPGQASEGVCDALEKLFSLNQTLEDFDVSGEDSRLESTRLGSGIRTALAGLKHNKSLQILRIQSQELGYAGASALADVISQNSTLRQVHCERNAIPLSGLTHLVNAVASNTTLLFLPTLIEGRDAAIDNTRKEITIARSRYEGSATSSTSSKISSVRRNFAGLSLGAGGNKSSRNSPKLGPNATWTAQDEAAALRLISEGWEEQAARLDKLLDRNWRMYSGMPIADEDQPQLREASTQQRPGTAGSISKILERVATDRTPTVEKQIQLGDHLALEDISSIQATPEMEIVEFTSSAHLLDAIDLQTSPLLSNEGFALLSNQGPDRSNSAGSSDDGNLLEIKTKNRNTSTNKENERLAVDSVEDEASKV